MRRTPSTNSTPRSHGRSRAASAPARRPSLVVVTCLALCAVLPAPASAAVLFGHARCAADDAASITIPGFIVDDGPDRALIAAVSVPAGARVTRIAYGSWDFTNRFTVDDHGARCEIWTLAGPAVGEADVVVSLSAGGAVVAAVALFTNVDQVTPIPFATGASAANATTATLGLSGSDPLNLAFSAISVIGDPIFDVGSVTPLAPMTAIYQEMMYVPPGLRGAGGLRGGASSVTARWEWTTSSGTGAPYAAVLVDIKDASLPRTNSPPTAIALAGGSVNENAPAGTVAGTLGTTDPDPGDQFTYTLVPGAGDAGNASFAIVGDQLRTARPFDFETENALPVRVRSTDAGGLFVERVFVVTVSDVNEAPTDLALDPAGVAENQPAGALVGTLSATDPDAGDAFTYGFAAGPGDEGNGAFAIVDDRLETRAWLDFEARDAYPIRVWVADRGGLRTERSLTVRVVDVNEPPVAVAGPDREVLLGDPVTLNGSASTDPDTDPGKRIVAHRWSLGDGQWSDGAETVYTYPVPGLFIARLTVTDGGGLVSTAATRVRVQPPSEPLLQLIAAVQAMRLPPGFRNSLLAKLYDALAALSAGDGAASLARLDEFIAQVEAQRGRKLTPQQADDLTAAARRIMAAIRFQYPSGAPTTAVGPGAPAAFAARSVPNPFRSAAEIRFALPAAAEVRVAVYDVTGREVARLVDAALPAGEHRTTWRPAGAPSGVYLYRIEAGPFAATGRMLLTH